MNHYESILFTCGDGIVRLTLNQPERLNSFGEDMNREIFDALLRVETDPDARVLVLTGSGHGFCAGANLGELSLGGPVPDFRADLEGQYNPIALGGPAPDLGAVLEGQYNPIVEKMRALPVPIVCAVNGVAAGAGASFALACDIVIAARSASFIQAFTKIGLLPDMGGTFFPPHLIGTARAMGLALLAEPLSAQDAAAWGLIWRCVDDDQLPHATDDLVRRLVGAPKRALALTKHAIHASERNSLTQQLGLERDLQRSLGYTEDFTEGVAAFRAKRRPQFMGR